MEPECNEKHKNLDEEIDTWKLLNKFSSIISTSHDTSTPFDEKAFFSNYDFYEKYDVSHSFEKEISQHDYGHGMRNYKHVIMSITLLKDKEKVGELNYVVAEEVISKEELEVLAKYCQCCICTAPWYKPGFMIQCSCCIECLKLSHIDDHLIKKTRKYIHDNNTR